MEATTTTSGPEVIYLQGNHIIGLTLPLDPNVDKRWRKGELTRVQPDGSPWEGDQYALPSEPGELVDADLSGVAAGAVDIGGTERPRGNASRTDWAIYAVDIGACDAEQAATLTRDELTKLCTPPEEQPKVPGQD